MLTHLLAHHCGLVAHEFVYYLGNVHIYDDHVDALREQIGRDPYKFPTISFACAPAESIDDYRHEDFVVDGYAHHATVKMEMRK
jgi:thymidylate synthase